MNVNEIKKEKIVQMIKIVIKREKKVKVILIIIKKIMKGIEIETEIEIVNAKEIMIENWKIIIEIKKKKGIGKEIEGEIKTKIEKENVIKTEKRIKIEIGVVTITIIINIIIVDHHNLVINQNNKYFKKMKTQIPV